MPAPPKPPAPPEPPGVEQRGGGLPGPGSPLEYLVVFLAAVAVAAAGALYTGVPIPRVHDEFSYLFQGETFSLFRLANPPAPGGMAFFSPHILVEPAFAAKYPPGQGLFLALGFLVGLPIAGVWLSGGVAAVALRWCAGGVLSAGGARLVTMLFGVTILVAGTWTSTYWGGLVAFAGGALVLGFLVRLETNHRSRPGVTTTAAALAGVGAALLAISRPFEGLLLCGVGGVLWVGPLRRALPALPRRGPLLAAAAVAAALLFQGAVNHAVTGNPLRLPYAEFQARHLSVPSFMGQPPGTPTHPDPRLQREEALLSPEPRSWPRHTLSTHRWAWLAADEVMGLLPALALLPALLVGLQRHPRVVALLLLVPLLQSISTFTQHSHYHAPMAPAWFLLLGGMGLGWKGGRWRLGVAAAALLLAATSALPRWQGARNRNAGSEFEAVTAALRPSAPVLGFVDYGPGVSPHVSVVYNDPRLEGPVLLANDRGRVENCRVATAFPGRRVMEVRIEGGRRVRVVEWDAESGCPPTTPGRDDPAAGGGAASSSGPPGEPPRR